MALAEGEAAEFPGEERLTFLGGPPKRLMEVADLRDNRDLLRESEHADVVT